MRVISKTFFLLIPLFFCSCFLFGQSEELCQGKYYTEEQGAEKLAALRQRIKSKSDWEAHADSIRNHVRKGMELDKLPARNALNPKFRNKKTLDGYTVESVVFESL